MDVPAMRAIQRELERAASDIQSQLTILRRNNQALDHNNWVANSANQYHAEFSQLTARLSKIAQNLNAVSAGLAAEIAHWESMDKTFG